MLLFRTKRGASADTSSLAPYWDCGSSPTHLNVKDRGKPGSLFMGDWSRLCLNLILEDWSVGRRENEILARHVRRMIIGIQERKNIACQIVQYSN
jgi:hypothetical protein